ncbi:AAEL012544-PA [Aedes aegypti]|uniref:AAEL012544-PA n=1 Tax=Aedes aegypti TaxID=7159 RepID=Q16LS2_AEDAE|nr:AAEL012544-PA [Aedes aegypti]
MATADAKMNPSISSAGVQAGTPKTLNFGVFENYVAGDDFEVYEERMTQHFLLHDVPEERKVAFLLTPLGMDTYAILKKLLQPVNPSTKRYERLVLTLKRHFRQK